MSLSQPQLLPVVRRPCHSAGKELQVAAECSGFHTVGKYFAHLGSNFFRLHNMPCFWSQCETTLFQCDSIFWTISNPIQKMAASTSKWLSQGPKSDPLRS